ncbi:TrbG/VirB9 family P-type conjugative transfer protein [Francisella philomiragia]|uniref:TrbG/VirB9 family P-type conjugative transfer protein n=1 Tax=Francisella philomiragia TaxID=28110 RepID=UPI001902D18B|nr:TrbG/VirB9 family P-type conjugative transfer protein [Francisella philomiragia]MBK2270172.1 TrbG/VirB9 family P-type conjugative transfer protein [Francisella philomiragia]MBK2275836.1 TrbG/VirB9 family P-type conjugative transfer protein [Francisella philomiragia]MBK2305049.1 TrbG/VirB9 family P-type conjugative transfer protein [Francisella philomiragia]
MLNTKNIKKIVLISFIGATLGSCTSVKNEVGGWMGFNTENYLPQDQRDEYFKKHYLSKGVKVPKVEYELEKIPVSRSGVLTSYGFSDKPEVEKAYEEYVNGGKNTVVRGEGFITYPYDPYSKPTLECSFNRVCAIQLQEGEQLTSAPVLGDSERWVMDVMTTGDGDKSSQLVTLKPIVTQQAKSTNFSTNLMMTTTKRVYNIKLVADGMAGKSNTMNFYYPFDTAKMINAKVEQAKIAVNKPYMASDNLATNVDFNTINPEKYEIKAPEKNPPEWTPLVVFDDGHKTFIKLPSNTDSYQLPAVWVERSDGSKQLSSNDTFQKPYFIIDGVYKKIFLFSGADKQGNKQEVEIIKK